MSTFQGNNGQIHFDGAAVTITREGGLGKFSELPTVTFPVDEILDVLVHDPVAILAGWVHIATAGHESMPSATEVGKSPNTVTMSKKQFKELGPFLAEIRAAIGKA